MLDITSGSDIEKISNNLQKNLNNDKIMYNTYFNNGKTNLYF